MITDPILALQNGSDIRGVALDTVAAEPVTLTPELASRIGGAFVAWLTERTGRAATDLTIAIGRDSRISGPALSAAVAAAITGCGAGASDAGLASTPAMFMSTILPDFACDGAIMLTASHLPSNRNGLKFFTADGGLEKADIRAILDRVVGGALPSAARTPGVHGEIPLMDAYAAGIVDMVRTRVQGADPLRPLDGLHIVVDAGNGAGGFYVTKVLEPLGATTTGSQFLDPDGHFPNHIPNPEDAEAMASIRQAVRDAGADLGLIFDTDVDRASAVDADGTVLNRNALIAAIAAIILEDHPGTTIVTDSITSSGLTTFIEAELGGRHHRFKRGYKNVINEAQRLNAEGQDTQLAIETSGHAAFKENRFLDDGSYLVTRFVVKLARLRQADPGARLGALIAGMPEPVEDEEFRIKISAPDFAAYGQSVLDALAEAADQADGWLRVTPNYEGVRVACDEAHGNGWFLLRLSLHDPVLPLNIESNTAGGVRVMAKGVLKCLAPFDALDTTALLDYLK